MKNLIIFPLCLILSGCGTGVGEFFSGVNTAKDIQKEENQAVKDILAAIKELPAQVIGEIIVPPGWANNTDENVVFKITVRESMQLTLFQAMQLAKFDLSDPLFLRYAQTFLPAVLYFGGRYYDDRAAQRSSETNRLIINRQYDYLEDQTSLNDQLQFVGEGTVLLNPPADAEVEPVTP
ncbi:MAG: hypothetical protein AAGJ81_14755 [Verrucomicrobiota bacterium]